MTDADRGGGGVEARRGAARILSRVLDEHAMPGEAPGGSAEVRAQAGRLADMVFRRLAQIDAVLQDFVARPPRGSARQILRVMAAELLFAGTPPHAAVDTAVRLARSERRTGRVAGLVNAVGRRLAAEGPALVAAQDETALAMPGWLRKRLVADWGPQTTDAIARAHLAGASHDLTPANPADAGPLATETGGTVLSQGSVRLPGRPQISALPGFAEGAWWVQDAAAALPVRLFGNVAGLRVLDLCAAPGGKTLQLAAAGASVVALDLSEHRMRRVGENLKRTGLSAELIVADALEWQPEHRFDAVLVDAPCSSTGTVRRHPDLPHRIDPRQAGQQVGLQQRLIERAFDWVMPGGAMVYCTCSLFREEGEEMLARFLAATPLADLGPASGLPGEFVAPEGWIRTRPDMWAGQGGIDGFFAARVDRRRP